MPGHSSMVLEESDLDARIDELDRTGPAHDGPRDVTTTRALTLIDPDGNRLVFTGA